VSQKVLILGGFVVTLVILSFFLIRKTPPPPVQLELKDSPPKTPKELLGNRQDRYTNTAQWLEDKDTDPAIERRAREKTLNVLFNWNGHSWDAFEVLGIPAGSSRDAVLQAFTRARAQSDPESHAFLQAAFDAINRTF